MVFLLGVLGLIFGSFSGATAWRIHKRMEAEDAGKQIDEKYSVSRGRSLCESCGHELAALDLVPLLSWLVLRGRCRYCRTRLSWEYPLIELVMAGLFVVSYLVLAPTSLSQWLYFAYWLYLVTSLLILAVSDLKWMLLPDVVLLPALALATALALAQLLAGGSAGMLLAGLVAGGAFLALSVLSGGRGMGMGDVKLAALMGVVLGPLHTVIAMLIGFNSAAVVSLGLIALHRKRAKDHIPFGPFLIAGLVIALLWGAPISTWYLRVAGL